MSLIKKNIIANLLGKALSVVLSLIFVPIYLKYLGAEAYGIIGVFGVLQSIFMMADMGLSGTLTRETARLSVIENKAHHMRNLCRTFEVIFAAVGLLIGLVIAALSPLIAERWVNLNHLSAYEVTKSIVLIGVAIGLQFPFYIYQGGLIGLQRQVNLNALLLGIGFARGFGAVLILKFVDSSIYAFFIWQVIVSTIQLLAGHLLLWINLPPVHGQSRFDLNLIRPIWRFAAGTAGVTFTGILLTQADKLILTKILPLEQFGYYALASVVAGVPGMVAIPFSNAIYPRLTQLVAERNFLELTNLYHRSCQVLAVLVLPLGILVALFSKELIMMWTGNSSVALNTYQPASILMIGSILMGLMMLPYTLQLAFGWTKLGLYLNIIAVTTLIPSMAWLVSIYGTIGACFVWVALYLGQIIGMIHLMHRRILKGEKWKWYIDDVIKPLWAPLAIITVGRLFIDETLSTPVLLTSLGCLFFLATCASAVSAPIVREIIIVKISNFRRRG